jgi:hypothetical protein
MGMEPPVVSLDRDFDVETAGAPLLSAVNTLFTSGLLDRETALRILQRGELFDDTIEIEDIMSRAENEQLKDIEMQVERTSALAEVGEGTPPADDAE